MFSEDERKTGLLISEEIQAPCVSQILDSTFKVKNIGKILQWFRELVM